MLKPVSDTIVDSKSARDNGFMVDSCCYPWVAYKGPRFNPKEYYVIPTDTEFALKNALHMQGVFVEQRDVYDFHRKFSVPMANKPSFLDGEAYVFRVNFMQEELDEYRHAVAKGDMEQAFDALIDLVYVALGTAHGHRFKFNEGFDRVHTVNMCKTRALRAEDSKRGSKYDVIKPLGWQPASLADLL